VLIAPTRSTATLRLATQLLFANEGKRSLHGGFLARGEGSTRNGSREIKLLPIEFVIPAKTGIPGGRGLRLALESRFCGGDDNPLGRIDSFRVRY
jgi:hypothetical protein